MHDLHLPFPGRLRLAIVTGLVVAAAALSPVTATPSGLDGARAATARFHSLAEAAAAGYGQPPAPQPLHYCIDDQMGMGAMGFHYINGALLSSDEAGVVDANRPEVLVYAPDKHGTLKLAALEYVIFQADWQGSTPPTLFDQEFSLTLSPNRYEIPAFYSLHVWLWQDNPDPVHGIFAPMNANVSCG